MMVEAGSSKRLLLSPQAALKGAPCLVIRKVTGKRWGRGIKPRFIGYVSETIDLAGHTLLGALTPATEPGALTSIAEIR